MSELVEKERLVRLMARTYCSTNKGMDADMMRAWRVVMECMVESYKAKEHVAQAAMGLWICYRQAIGFPIEYGEFPHGAARRQWEKVVNVGYKCLDGRIAGGGAAH